MQCWEGPRVGRQENPLERCLCGKLVRTATTGSCLQRILWPGQPHRHRAVGGQMYQRCLYSDGVGPFVLLSAHYSQCLISFCFFPGSVSIIAAAIIFYIGLTRSTSHVLDTALLHAVLWAGSSVATSSNHWASGGLHLFLRASDPTVYSHLLVCVVMFLGHRVFLGFLD